MKTFIFLFLFLNVSLAHPQALDTDLSAEQLAIYLGVLRDEHDGYDKQAMHLYHRFKANASTDTEKLGFKELMVVAVLECENVEEIFFNTIKEYPIDFLIENDLSSSMPRGWCGRDILDLMDLPAEPAEMPEVKKVTVDDLKEWASIVREVAETTGNRMDAYANYFQTTDDGEKKQEWIARHMAERVKCLDAVRSYNLKVSIYSPEELEKRKIWLSLHYGWCKTPSWLTTE